MNPWLVLFTLVLVALVYVVAPVISAAWSHYRRYRRLRCPVDGVEARVRVDAGRAAVGEALGRPALHIGRCSLWPQRLPCEQACTDLLANEAGSERHAAALAPTGRIRKILVPLDGSSGSESVLWTVGQLARVQGASVSLLRVATIPPPVLTEERVIAFADQESDRVERGEIAGLRRLADKLAGVVVETSVRFGDPATEIVDTAESTGVDLIAMATHRRAGLARMVKGSVAERVERATTVPVILVPYGE
jgi:nucleotide-binding universal stress UspA family protein